MSAYQFVNLLSTKMHTYSHMSDVLQTLEEVNAPIYQTIFPEFLKFSFQTLQLPTNRMKVNALQCLNMPNITWYVIFAFIDQFMYLLEPSTNTTYPKLRITGIIEPNAVIKSSEPNNN